MNYTHRVVIYCLKSGTRTPRATGGSRRCRRGGSRTDRTRGSSLEALTARRGWVLQDRAVLRPSGWLDAAEPADNYPLRRQESAYTGTSLGDPAPPRPSGRHGSAPCHKRALCGVNELESCLFLTRGRSVHTVRAGARLPRQMDRRPTAERRPAAGPPLASPASSPQRSRRVSPDRETCRTPATPLKRARTALAHQNGERLLTTGASATTAARRRRLTTDSER